jgi:hypothetical protein
MCDVSGLTYVEVFGVNLTMFGQVVVFLGHEHPLPEEVLVDSLAVGFGDEPGNLVSLNEAHSLDRTYIVASSWRYSGNRVQWLRSRRLTK